MNEEVEWIEMNVWWRWRRKFIKIIVIKPVGYSKVWVKVEVEGSFNVVMMVWMVLDQPCQSTV